MYEGGFAACCGAKQLVGDVDPNKPEGKVLSGFYGKFTELETILKKPVYGHKGDGFRICILTDGSGLEKDGKNYIGQELVDLLIKETDAKLLATFERVYTPGSYCYVMGWYTDMHAKAFKTAEPAKPRTSVRKKLTLAFKGRKRAA